MDFPRNKKVVVLILLVALFAALGFFLSERGQETISYVNVTPGEAREMIDSRSPVILDVRTPDEFENGHVPGAILVPIDELKDSTFLKIPKDEEILIYCRSGHRSSWGAEYLARMGYASTYNLSGGIMVWEDQGYSVVKSRDAENKPTCPCAVVD